MLAAPFPALRQALATVLRFHLVKESLPHNAAVCVCVCIRMCVFFIVIGISVAQWKWEECALRKIIGLYSETEGDCPTY